MICPNGTGDWESETKRFGYATVTGPPLEIEKFKATYSGSKWAGSIMRIEEAKMHYLEKLRAEWAAQHLKDVERANRREKKSAILLEAPSHGGNAWSPLVTTLGAPCLALRHGSSFPRDISSDTEVASAGYRSQHETRSNQR